jgi:GGDEF domain-containing protein
MLAIHNSKYRGIALSLSVGAATGDEGCRLDEIMKEADNQMYQDKQAKKAGARNASDQPAG